MNSKRRSFASSNSIDLGPSGLWLMNPTLRPSLSASAAQTDLPWPKFSDLPKEGSTR